MHTRLANTADIPELSSLCTYVQQMHVEAYPDLFKPPIEEDFAVSFFEMIMLKSNFRTFIAEQAGEAVGYIVLQVVHREENPFTYPREYLHIDQISVEPEHQGKGVGKALMDCATQMAKEEGLSQVTLASWMFNQKAHEFFKSQGYEISNIHMWKKM